MTGGVFLDWFGTIATAPLLLLAGSAAVWGFSRSSSMSALYAAMFGFLFLDNSIAGNAEPMLLFLETVALAVLVCAPECELLAAVALTGVVLTKVEGAAFVGVVILWKLLAAATARLRQGLSDRTVRWRVFVAPVLVLVAWIAFCARHGLLDSYRRHPGDQHLALAVVFKPLLVELTMHALYVPWIALALLIILGHTRAAVPLVIASATYLLFLIIVWAGGAEENIALEISWSARRVLVTPLVLLFFAAVAAGKENADRASSELKDNEGGLSAALER
jgi:hypothetical protein